MQINCKNEEQVLLVHLRYSVRGCASRRLRFHLLALKSQGRKRTSPSLKLTLHVPQSLCVLCVRTLRLSLSLKLETLTNKTNKTNGNFFRAFGTNSIIEKGVCINAESSEELSVHLLWMFKNIFLSFYQDLSYTSILRT